MIPLSSYIGFGATLFTIGIIGVLTRRNAIIVLMSIELMLNAVNVNFLAFSLYAHDLTGQVFALFVIAVAAAEAAVGLAIIILLYRKKGSINVDEMHFFKW